VQYGDYAIWQRKWLAGAAPRQLAFWRAAMAGAPAELRLPADRTRPEVMSYRGSVVRVEADAALHCGLHALARANGATFFMVMQAAFAALLSKLGAGDDIPIGTPVAGRGERAGEELIGLFVNTLVMRIDVSGAPTFTQLVRRVRAFALEAFEHQDLPFEQLVEALKPERALARNPLFQVMLLVEHAGDPELTLPGLVVSAEPCSTGIARFDLTLAVRERVGAAGERLGLDAAFEYSADLFDRATVESIATRLVRLLEAAVAAPDAPLHRLDVLDKAERKALLPDAAETRYVHAPRASVPERFAAQASRTPDAVALVFSDEVVTYAELAARARRVANHLVAHGVGRGSFVGIDLERSVEMVVALLGVLQAGAAYVPLDPEYPPARRADMLADAAPAFVITREVVWQAAGAGDAIAARPGSADPAYVIYTSGSTGRPKGVVVPHGALSAFVEAVAEHVPFGAGDRHLAVTTIGFDISILEIVVPLCGGAQVWIADRATARDPVRLGAMIRAGGITSMQATPSHWNMLVREDPDCLTGLRVLTGGEALPTGLARVLHERGAEVLNLYGPTEATVWASASRVSHADLAAAGVVTIGRALSTYRIYVLDAALEPVPRGVVGELYIAGPALARGYLNQPASSAERFVADPHAAPGARMYRTGDLASRRSDGALDFYGRSDEQVKVRGFRIEPGEIAAALERHESVAHAAVVVRNDALVAYVVQAPGFTADAAALRRALAQRLPDYMIPAAFVSVDAMPMTPNGKLDRRALPDPVWTTGAYREPRTPDEAVIAGLFADVLGLGRVGADDDFFASGGHSLLATRLASRIRNAFHVDLPLKVIFEKPTAAGIAEVLGEVQELTRQIDDMSLEQIEALLRQEEGA
jgi:amino acid adenylation domain-containing protein